MSCPMGRQRNFSSYFDSIPAIIFFWNVLWIDHINHMKTCCHDEVLQQIYILVLYACGSWAFLVKVTITVIKHHDQSNLKRKGFLWLTLPQQCLALKDIRAGTWRQGVMLRPWRGAAYWLAFYGLLSLFAYRTLNHQTGDGSTHNGLAGPFPIDH